MSKLYGTIDGAAKNQSTQRGHSTLTTHAACWEGAIRTDLELQPDGRTRFVVSLVPWKGSGGITRELASGWCDASLERNPRYESP